ARTHIGSKAIRAKTVARDLECNPRTPPSPPAPLPILGEGSQRPSVPLPILGEGSRRTSPPLPGLGEGAGGVRAIASLLLHCADVVLEATRQPISAHLDGDDVRSPVGV